MVYYPNFYPGLPRLIAAVHDGDTTVFAAGLASLLAAMTDPATGTNLVAGAAVECRDRPRFHASLPEGADVFERTSLYGICNDWSALGPPPVVPRQTDVPTLILAGQFDPNARPAASRHVAVLIGRHARWLEFLGMGHSVRAFSPCAARITAEFFQRPDEAPVTPCAGFPRRCISWLDISAAENWRLCLRGNQRVPDDDGACRDCGAARGAGAAGADPNRVGVGGLKGGWVDGDERCAGREQGRIVGVTGLLERV